MIDTNKSISVADRSRSYDAYKDSTVEWLGEIPEQWKVKKLKFVAHIFNGDSLNESLKKQYSSENLEDLAYISSKDINVNDSSITYENGLRIPKDNLKLKVAPKDTSLLCIEGGSAGRKIAFTNQDVCFVNKLSCFLIRNEGHSKFLFFSLKGSPFQTQFNLSMSGLIGGVAISAINNFVIPIPPFPEQTAIANFLDDKTQKIDQAIGIKEQQIALLKERKQILIHKAVTRGLHENVALKDSGVEWIGEIPEHWEVRRASTLFMEKNRIGIEGLPLLSISIHSAVSKEEIDEENNVRGRVKIEDKSKYKLVQPNDIAFNMMRAWQGAIGAVLVNGLVSPAYVVAEPKEKIDSIYFEHQFRTPIFIQQINKVSKGITDFRKRLYWAEFRNLMIIVPPLQEQKQISHYIETTSYKIETAISLKQQEIEKMKEYKSSLINSVVTGKLKVC